MVGIKLNHWFVNNNELSISLMNYYVKINVLKNNQLISTLLTVINAKQETLVFNFDSIEKTILFVENIIIKCHDIHEITDEYMKLFENSQNEFLQSDDNNEEINNNISNSEGIALRVKKKEKILKKSYRK